MRYIAFDTETFPIGPANVTPLMVCLQFGERVGEEVKSYVLKADDPAVLEVLDEMLTNPEIALIGQRTCYDLGVIVRTFPQFTTKVWQKLEDGLVTDLKIREALLNLSSFGSLQYVRAPDGTNRRLGYGMDDLAKFYLGLDLSKEKGDDSWRINYHMLVNQPIEQWPPEAVKYAHDDAIHTLLIYEAQGRRVKSESGYASLSTEFWQTACDFALFMSTVEGFAVDHVEVARLQKWLDEQLTDAKVDLLLKEGILRPYEPTRPHKPQLSQALDLVGGIMPKDWTPHRPRLEQLGIRFTAPVEQSVDTKLLKARVLAVANANGIRLKLTEGGTDAKRAGEPFDIKHVSTDSEVMDDLSEHDPVLGQYQHRQVLQKLVTTELDCTRWLGEPAPRVYGNFNVLVETGRTSSNNGGKKPLYPARNMQNPHPKARPMFVPDAGNVLVSVDYSSLELVTLAQVTYRIFGQSRLRDLINSGINPHTYMGAQLANALSPEFRSIAEKLGIAGDPMKLHDHFLAMKKHEDPKVREFFEHWRKFAKPTNLGYPGGLGPVKFISYAKKTYGVICDHETAKMLREVFRATFPEVPAFHNHVSNNMIDPDNPSTWDEEDEQWVQSYAYTSYLGMHRANATFCATANGYGMQTPGAEPGKWAYFRLSRACYDPSLGSVLFGARPKAFIHDEALVQVSADPDLGSAQTKEVQRIMEEELSKYCPDVKVATEAAMMLRWDKAAKPKFNTKGRLTPWTPELS